METTQSPQNAGDNTPIPTTETEPEPQKSEPSQGGSTAPSTVRDGDWQAMQNILKTVYDHRVEDDHDVSKLFHKNVNKRNLPDYYEVIKEPMALSIIKKRIALRDYKSFEDFVRDFALVGLPVANCGSLVMMLTS